MNDELNYYKLDEFYTKCMNGSLNIHDPIQLKDRGQTKIYAISFLSHVLYLCKANNMNLLDILNILKDKIETFVKRLIRENFYIKNYIDSIILEWSLDLEAENIFNEMTEVFKYDMFVEENRSFNQLIGGMKNLEKNIKNKEYSVDSDIKDTLLLLFTNCKDCKGKIQVYIKKLVDITGKLEPTYNYLLLDLSNKGKPNYLEQVDEINEKNSIFNRLLNTSSDKDIPENINTIFLNYILIINSLKKQYHYLITTLKTIDDQIDNRHNTLNNLMQGLNIHNEINNKVDIKQDIDDISSSEEDDEDFKLF